MTTAPAQAPVRRDDLVRSRLSVSRAIQPGADQLRTPRSDAEDADEGETFLARAVRLAEQSVAATANGTPIGAVLAVDGAVVGEGASCVVDRFDPTAHAEVQALRDAGQRLRTHLFPGAVLYTSLAPCPLCLAACYWAQLSRVVYAAGYDVSTRFGFDDAWMFGEMAKPPEVRVLPVEAAGGGWAERASEPCRAWARKHGSRHD